MKALLINGSPHTNGCTFTALNIVAEEFQKNGIETEIIHIGNKDIRAIAAEREHNGLPEKEVTRYTNFIR